MLGRTHEIGAVAAALTIAPVITDSSSIYMTAGFIVCAAIGGLLPDADTPNSKIGHRIFPLAWPAYLLRAILRLIGKVIRPIGNLTKILAHRGIFHSPFIWTILFLACLFAADDSCHIYIYGTMIGIASHLLLDYIAGGIPLLLPFTKKRFRFPLSVKTGGAMEFALEMVMLTYCLLTVSKQL